jgi:non-specific protein-tyrosine kinase
MLGFGVGILLATVLATILYRVDGRVEDGEEVAALLRLRVLGRVVGTPVEMSAPGQVVSLGAPAGSAAEAYRRLCATVSHALASEHIRTLLFVSGGDGEGSSVVLANTAVALARTGKRVVAVDGDLRSPSLHQYFDVPNEDGVSSIIAGRTSLSAALHLVDLGLDRALPGAAAGKGQGSLSVLTSGPAVLDPGGLVAGPALAEILAELGKDFDVVFVDAPGLLDAADASSLAFVVDGLLVVVDPAIARRPALQQSREYLDRVPCRQMGIVIMQESRRRSRKGRGRTKRARAAESEASESAAPAVSASPGG